MGLFAISAHAELDAATALEVLKRNDCTKCHSVQKSKNGPAYTKVAQKYRGDPKAEEKLFKHLTSNPKVKLSDGSEEDHKKTDFDNPEHLKEFIRWILSL
ncbi:MAG: cytochrome C [Magnetococcales bacterium]|nr:cytochrome C [Magnetococcales bacterium]MBF0308035.1 cytochrome C [Magnetococcales bacterium]